MADLFTIRDREQAAKALATLERYADRRDGFIDALDFASLDPSSQTRIAGADHATSEAVLFGHLYLMHLAQMEELGAWLNQHRLHAA